MPPMTFPNQRIVTVHRERATTNFLGIKNENWRAAARDLGAHAFMLYIYLASNADNYSLALSPVAVRQEIGMARSTYHDQFHKLIDKGYLVQSNGNTFEFYEIPQAASRQKNSMPHDGLNFEESTARSLISNQGGHSVLPEDTEINNITDTENKSLINIGSDQPIETHRKAVFDF